MPYDGPIFVPAEGETTSADEVWRQMMHRADAETARLAAIRHAAGAANLPPGGIRRRRAGYAESQLTATPSEGTMHDDKDEKKDGAPASQPGQGQGQGDGEQANDLDRNNDGRVDQQQQQ